VFCADLGVLRTRVVPRGEVCDGDSRSLVDLRTDNGGGFLLAVDSDKVVRALVAIGCAVKKRAQNPSSTRRHLDYAVLFSLFSRFY
jgi:hypothetical protein